MLVRDEPDGDLHIDVALDGAYRRLLRAGNYSQQHGDLVVEFMARDGGHLPAPAPGDSVRLVGAWVDDTEHGWNEIHPVWRVSIDDGRWDSSGPQFGGSRSTDRSYDAASDCRTAGGRTCRGYGSVPGERAPAALPPAPAPPAGGSTGTGATFCSTHRCIASFDEGSGYIVRCNDGEWSHSGGRPGACSSHGGESAQRYR